MNWLMTWLRKLAISGLAALVMGSSSSCATISYYGSLVENHLSILYHARDIEEVLQDSSIDEETKRKLRLVQEVRKYSIEKLHLPDTKAYTSYVDLQGLNGEKKELQEKDTPDYAVIFITACRSDSFEIKEWWYPVVGYQQMRTFYDKQEAEEYAKELQEEGWDVALNEARAYSTGNYLNGSLLEQSLSDPVTNIMLNQSDTGIIESLFHEMAHQVIYIEEDSTFNESFAEFVGEEGTRQYVKDHRWEFPKMLEEKQKRRKDEGLFHEIIASYKNWLALVYDSALPKEEKLQRKRKIFQAMKDAYLQEADAFC